MKLIVPILLNCGLVFCVYLAERSEFAKKCKETVAKYEKEFKDLWISLGFSVDWNLQYETINDTAQRVSQRSFLELLKAGKAYRNVAQRILGEEVPFLDLDEPKGIVAKIKNVFAKLKAKV